ncbi:MAG: transposase [Bdellovibrionaceae bacterium]|nr:transposase [Pseudobdellovibrionaceae bacterium]
MKPNVSTNNKSLEEKMSSGSKRKTSKSKQLSFFGDQPQSRVFGGALLKGNPKTRRPISTKEPIHLVLKSKFAFGPRSMLQRYNVNKIEEIVRKQAKKCGLRIYHFVNVGNHLHLVIKLHDRKGYAKFIRALSGLIARHVLKKERGPTRNELSDENRASRKMSFWVARPFTRLIAWGRDYNHVARYMEKNRDQSRQDTPSYKKVVAWGFDIIDLRMLHNLNTS